MWKFLLITEIVTYVICVSFFYFFVYRNKERQEELRGEDLSFRLIIYLVLFFPGVNQLLAIALIVSVIVDYIKKVIEKYKEIHKIRKEREEKIKLGIIRITKDDPYGEEDWTDYIKNEYF